jgi:hypothetical protein
MHDLNEAVRSRTAFEGFTAQDWSELHDAYRSGAGRGGWGHAQAASNDFSHYLAIWHEPPAGREPPNLAIVRFAATGTYALLAGDTFVVTGASLRELLPALSARRPAVAEED